MNTDPQQSSEHEYKAYDVAGECGNSDKRENCSGLIMEGKR